MEKYLSPLSNPMDIEIRKMELEYEIATHDCHSGPEDGCICGEAIRELAMLTGNSHLLEKLN